MTYMTNAEAQANWERERAAYLLADVPTADELAAQHAEYDRIAAARLAGRIR